MDNTQCDWQVENTQLENWEMIIRSWRTAAGSAEVLDAYHITSRRPPSWKWRSGRVSSTMLW